MRYYGIAAIPTQVLLANDSEEYFRHSGFISSIELTKKFKFYE
jgi:thioredoxin 1